MQELKGSDRKYLRRLAHSLKPVVYVGKGGLTGGLIDSVSQALDVHELIKVRFVEFKGEKKALSAKIAGQAGCEQVGMIGHVAIFYREHPEAEKRKIQLP